MSVRVSVGLDYHMSSVQVCVLAGDGTVLGNHACPNDRRQIVQYVQRFGGVEAAGIEACCGAAALADELIQHAAWPLKLAHPGFVRRMKQNPDKTDYSDARLLADLARVGYLPLLWLAPAEIRDLRQLVRYRQQGVNAARNVKLRIRALLREHRLKPALARLWTRAGLTWLRTFEGLGPQSRWVLDRHLEDFEQHQRRLATCVTQLRAATANDPLVLRLLEEPGVGLVTACVLRAEIGWFERFGSGKQLARFCGLSPRNASSGQRQADAGLIKAGNPLLRATLIELAHRLAWHVPRWRALRQKLLSAGKPKCVAAAALANRWVRGLYHQMLSTAA